MNKAVLGSIIIGFGLASCGQMPSPGPFEKETAKLCGYIPTAETIAGIVASATPGLSTVTQVAKAICAALQSGRESGGGAYVAGVRIEGHYARR